MYSKTITCNLTGLEANFIETEADISKGLSAFNIVGLPDTSIKESKDRVRAAMINSGYKFPLGRITVNLAPANIRKEGSQLDLSIAISILTSMGVVFIPPDTDLLLIGELSLDGRIVAIPGALPMIISMKEKGISRFIVPYDNRIECGLIQGIEIFPVHNLNEVISFLNKEKEISPFSSTYTFSEDYGAYPNFSDMRGQHNLKRALEISASGFHNLLMVGPPGSGKTMAAMRLPSIMPPLSFDESIECTKIYSSNGELEANQLINRRPFRSPHHTASTVSLVGGGRIPKPGEVSLAHNGVLFLDELPEFNRTSIESLRQPIEDHEVTISRINASIKYPSRFLLIGSMNPCPCGYYGDPHHECICSSFQIANYMSRISHPILDRIDIHVHVEPLPLEELSSNIAEEDSQSIRNRVCQAIKIQRQRFAETKSSYNAHMDSDQLDRYCYLGPPEKSLMKVAFKKYKFSARSYNKILKISRTIADLDNSDSIKEHHLLEAIRYRRFEN